MYIHFQNLCGPALMAGSSHPCGPKRGIVINVPTLFGTGFENVQRVSFPREDNQPGFVIVNPTKGGLSNSSVFMNIAQRPTFEIDSRSADDLVVSNIIRRRAANKQRRRMYKYIFQDSKSLIWDSLCIRILCSGCLAFVDEIFAHSHLVNETCC